MGAQLRYGTAGATGGGFSAQPGSLQPAFAEPWAYPKWCWQARSPRTWKDPNNWRSRWSFGVHFSGAGFSAQDGAANIGNDLTSPCLFEPYSCDGAGTQSLKFIKGQTIDESSNALSGVTVQAFRTSDDAFAGYEVQSREDGSYDLATNFPGVNHYVVAYLAGSPDRAGTTVNTLVPANIDGT